MVAVLWRSTIRCSWSLPPVMFNNNFIIFYFLALFLLSSAAAAGGGAQVHGIERVKELVTKWAPLIWMAPDEQFYPSDVEHFLDQVHVENEDGKLRFPSFQNAFSSDTRKLYLVTNDNIDFLKKNSGSFIYGKNPQYEIVPIYAIVTLCSPNTSFLTSENIINDMNILFGKAEPPLPFHVTYWIFYPYNKGKQICFLGKVPSISIFGRCLGHFKTLGNHVGDWERVSLTFKGKETPSDLYLAVHNTGCYYKFDPIKNVFTINTNKNTSFSKYAPIIHLQNDHPVIFSADGSHGLWAAPGDHQYAKIPKLIDRCGYGVPWKTWANIKIYISDLPVWATFKGKWGNPKSECVLFKKFGLCGHSDGPPGILRIKKDFYC